MSLPQTAAGLPVQSSASFLSYENTTFPLSGKNGNMYF